MPAANLVPPFTRETATLKVRAAENNWNTRNPEKVSQGYTVDSRWRNRSEFMRPDHRFPHQKVVEGNRVPSDQRALGF
jgi:nuclear transport factor 2 (NTF2) superfamily protein